jgi:hypothetical protein
MIYPTYKTIANQSHFSCPEIQEIKKVGTHNG